MYEFLKTETGWLVCWGPLPVSESSLATAREEVVRREVVIPSECLPVSQLDDDRYAVQAS